MLVGENQVLLCYLTTNTWGPGPPAWTQCRGMTVSGNQITASTPYTFGEGGFNTPGDIEASQYWEFVKVSDTEALFCRIRGVDGWVNNRSLNGGERWDNTKTYCGIMTLANGEVTNYDFTREVEFKENA